MRSLRYYLKRLRGKTHPVKFLVARLLWQSSLVRIVPLTIDRGIYRMRFYPAKIAADLWADPGFNRREDRFFSAYVQEGDTVVDVGANIGSETLTAAVRADGGGSVFAVEPQPRIFRYLQRNLALNAVGNVRAFNVAIDETEGIVSILDRPFDHENRVVQGSGIQVTAKRLDDLLEPFTITIVHLLKVDVEGFEYNVLRSAPRILADTRCVYFEHIPKNFARYGRSEADIFGLLTEAGFELFMLEGDPKNVLALRSREEFMARTGGALRLAPVRDQPPAA